MAPKVLVVGATSGVGLEFTKILAESNDYEVYALVRSEERARNTLGSACEKVKLIVGDITKPETLPPAVQGKDAIVCTVGSKFGWRLPPHETPQFIDYGGVKSLAEAAAEAKVPKFVLVSSIAITRTWSPVPIILNLLKSKVLVWKLKGEEAMKEAYGRNPELSYYIVRPGQLVDKEACQHKIVVGQGDKLPVWPITRKDVALVAKACLDGLCPCANVTFEVIGDSKKPYVPLQETLAELKSDK